MKYKQIDFVHGLSGYTKEPDNWLLILSAILLGLIIWILLIIVL